VEQIDYLGHHIVVTPIRPLESRLAAIQPFLMPKTVPQFQTYLGMVNFSRRFFLAAAAMLRPLTVALKGNQKVDLVWSVEMCAAFATSKAALCAAAELAHPLQGATLLLAVDASITHFAAVLQQHVAGTGVRPQGFFSIKLEPAQQKYSSFDMSFWPATWWCGTLGRCLKTASFAFLLIISN
jgi:RNase H-like domain found in reverse transcriptase